MTIDFNNKYKQYILTLKIALLLLICFSLIASTAISMPSLNIIKSIDNYSEIGSTSLQNCSVDIIKPARGIGYFFDEFEFPLVLLTVPVIIGGITCRAEVNITNGEEPDYLQWKFANFLGDIYWSFPINYESGVTKYEYYMGKPNIGQFKVWIYCYDTNSQLMCGDTISCLKIL